MKELFERNYKAVVNRGLIDESTPDYQFLRKLNEEYIEVKYELLIRHVDNDRINEEIADCLIVCSNWLIHRGIDLNEILIKIAKKNESKIIKS